MKLKTLMTTTVIATAMAIPQVVMSDTASDTGAGALTAGVDLDFQVIIPQFLDFRVGTDAPGSIDLITLTVPAANVGDTVPLPFTGGDAGGGAVNVSVKSNAGQVTITETNNSIGAGMDNGAGANIPYSEIDTVSSLGALDPPTLSNAGGGFSTPTLNGGDVTNRTAVWTYSYLNTQVYDAGTYGGSTKGGRVTYTATTPP